MLTLVAGKEGHPFLGSPKRLKAKSAELEVWERGCSWYNRLLGVNLRRTCPALRVEASAEGPGTAVRSIAFLGPSQRGQTWVAHLFWTPQNGMGVPSGANEGRATCISYL